MNNNYRNQIIDYLNRFLSTNAILTSNMQNYHWNLVGSNFFPLHVKWQEYYEKGQDEVDVIAERIKQLGGYPITSLATYESNSGIRSLPSKNYTSEEVIRGTINDFEAVHKMGSDIASFAASSGDVITGDTIGKYLTYLEKQLWMLEANTK